jgi:hypothetical protein
MFLIHELKIIYVVVPATGSTAFWNSLKKKYELDFLHKRVPDDHPSIEKGEKDGGIDRKHWRITRIKELVDEDTWNTYEKIAFVRHPYEWSWSLYNKRKVELAIGVDTSGDYSTYLKNLDKTPYWWFTDENGNVLVDTIYRTEDLDSIVFPKYEVPVNRSNIGKKKKEKISEEDEKLLKEKFHREFQHYGDA